jgi:hypothetical protein
MEKPKNQLRDDNFDRKKYKHTGKVHLASKLAESDEFAEKMKPILNYKFPKLEEDQT